MMSIIETYVHIIGIVSTVVFLGGYITYGYIKKRK